MVELEGVDHESGGASRVNRVANSSQTDKVHREKRRNGQPEGPRDIILVVE